MSEVRNLLHEADRLRQIANRATNIVRGMGIGYNRGHDIGGVTLYSHSGFPDDLVLIDAIKGALEQVATEHTAHADEIESRVAVTR